MFSVQTIFLFLFIYSLVTRQLGATIRSLCIPPRGFIYELTMRCGMQYYECQNEMSAFHGDSHMAIERIRAYLVFFFFC